MSDYAQKQIAAGLCANGDKHAIAEGSSRFCYPCIVRVREYHRKRNGWKPRKAGTWGKQPIPGDGA